MNLAVDPDEITAPESVQLKVLRLSAGFRQMQELGKELATLDLVNQDVWRTQASIRRDTANAVLQTAYSLKESQASTQSPTELRERLEPAPDINGNDIWAKKLLRWADQFGRELFGNSSARARAAKKSATTLPAPKP